MNEARICIIFRILLWLGVINWTKQEMLVLTSQFTLDELRRRWLALLLSALAQQSVSFGASGTLRIVHVSDTHYPPLQPSCKDVPENTGGTTG